MSPVSSATGMKSAGDTSPRLGWFQRSKRFERVDVVRFKVDERLIVQFEFFADQRLAQIHFQLAARLHARVHLQLEEPVGAAAVGFGAVERHVGVAAAADRHRRPSNGATEMPMLMSLTIW